MIEILNIILPIVMIICILGLIISTFIISLLMIIDGIRTLRFTYLFRKNINKGNGKKHD